MITSFTHVKFNQFAARSPKICTVSKLVGAHSYLILFAICYKQLSATDRGAAAREEDEQRCRLRFGFFWWYLRSPTCQQAKVNCFFSLSRFKSATVTFNMQFYFTLSKLTLLKRHADQRYRTQMDVGCHLMNTVILLISGCINHSQILKLKKW